MGRKRQLSDQWMPPRVYRGKAAFEFHPKIGGAIRLCHLDASRAVVWARYEQVVEERSTKAGTFGELLKDYLGSVGFKELSARTQKNYCDYEERLTSVFGIVPCNRIEPKHIRKYLDRRGSKSKYGANREIQFMKVVCSWGYERGRLDMNPCKGVRLFTEKPRSRYITDIEYKAVYDTAPDVVKAAMEIAYLCAARQSDILDMKLSQLRPEGIFIRQAKTGKAQIKTWTPRLRAALELAKSQPSEIGTMYVIHNRKGQRYTRTGFASMWRRARIKAGKDFKNKLDFTFHDIKAKSISDYDGDKQRFSGHKTFSQVVVYDRKTDVVDSLPVPNIRTSENGK